MKNFTNVTELPGQRSTSDQLSMMLTRYNLAKKYSKDKHVLEVACGSGTGLGYLAKDAKHVTGGDIDQNLVNIAKRNYQNLANVKIEYLEAEELPFENGSFDLVLLFEAIYYLSDVNKFIDHAIRVLKPNGKIIISTVNKEWHGFNASPHSNYYFSAEELLHLFDKKAHAELSIGFLDLPKGNNFVKSKVRKIASSLGLIPKKMKSKEFLKRIFYGKLKPIPAEISETDAEISLLSLYQKNKNDLSNYKQLYLIVTI